MDPSLTNSVEVRSGSIGPPASGCGNALWSETVE